MAENGTASPAWGTVLICGGTDWQMLGKTGGSKAKKTDKEKMDEAQRAIDYPNLPQPHRIKALLDAKIAFVASGSAACHSVIGDVDGRVWTFGRNDKGQLGVGDTVGRNRPTLVDSLTGYKVVGASAGKHHTLFWTEDGLTFACGSNLHGQCGTGSIKSKKDQEELLLTPVQVQGLKGVTQAAAGAEFSMWLIDGRVWSCGHPQYGQLGHGTDHEHNTKDTSIKIAYTPQPTPALIEALTPVTITRIACGHNHTLAVDNEGMAYSWGNGGYGRLGHKEQKDEFSPKAIDTFNARVKVNADTPLAAGSVSSFCTIVGGQLYAWGKLKVNGDNTMYPKALMELAGWNIRTIACGNTHYAAAAYVGDEEAAVTWGHGTYGELGYGPTGKKSSANPDKVPSLDGVKTLGVACGFGHTLFVVDPEAASVKDAPVWDCEIEETAAPPPKGAKGATGTKRKADGAKGKAAKRK